MQINLLKKIIISSVILGFLLFISACQNETDNSSNPLKDNQENLLENPFSPGYVILLPSFNNRYNITSNTSIDVMSNKSNSIQCGNDDDKKKNKDGHKNKDCHEDDDCHKEDDDHRDDGSDGINLQNILRDMHLTSHQNKAINGYYKDYLECLEEAYLSVDSKCEQIHKNFNINKNNIYGKLKKHEIDEDDANDEIDELSRKEKEEIDNAYSASGCACLNILMGHIYNDSGLSDYQRYLFALWAFGLTDIPCSIYFGYYPAP